MKLPKIEINKTPTYLKLESSMDFFELFERVEGEYENCFLFESLGEQGHLSRYSIIGFDPEHLIKAKGSKLYFDEQEFEVENPYHALRKIVPQNAISRNYAGGLIGYLGYDAVNYFEPSLKVKTHPKFDTFLFGVFLDGIVLDKVTGEIYYFYYEENRIDLVKKIISRHISFVGTQDDNKIKVKFLGDTLNKDEHAKAVEVVKEQILAGNTFQCEVGFKSEFEISGNALRIYQNLREINPSPFMYYLKFADQKIIGASPELLFSLKDGEMETHPLAGTTSRGQDEAQDQELAKKLLSDPKEVAEHNMLVDLHRNDIGKVARFGTVKVRNLMDIKRFSHVQHISSEITGLIAAKEDMFSALASNFPAGTLTGAPKIESIKIIDQLEKHPRGPYGGAIGQFGFNGDCTFAIAIRSLFISGNYGYTQTCGGIVYDSQASNEYLEIERKLGAMKEALKV